MFLLCFCGYNWVLKAMIMAWCQQYLRHFIVIPNIIRIFTTSEGRNPRVKNAFLALSYIVKSPILSRRMKTKSTLILFLYMIVRVQPTLYLVKVYKQRGVFVSLFISTAVFGDTYYVMSVTSPYAFLVSINQAQHRWLWRAYKQWERIIYSIINL